MYTLSKEEILLSIKPDTEIKHRGGFTIFVLEIKNEDDDVIITGSVGIEIKQFSFNALYNNKLILESNLLGKEKETSKEEAAIISEDSTNDVKELPKNVNKTFTYFELFTMMEAADKTINRYSRFFWHYTTIDNLIQIVKSKYIKSRYNCEGSIPHDNNKLNLVTKDVLSTNMSNLTIRHARFYLRPLNKSYFHWFYNLKVRNDAILICLKKEALYASSNSTFLYPFNAHSASDNDLQKENELNLKYRNRFKVNNSELFDFEKTYLAYEPDQSNLIHSCQQAEFLVWKDISIKFIDKIYFLTDSRKKVFLENIANDSAYNEIYNKCIVNSDIFYRYE